MTKDEYLKQQLEWVQYRLEVLDEIEEKLKKMRQIVQYARDNQLAEEETQELNHKLKIFAQEVEELDEKSKNFWLDWQ